MTRTIYAVGDIYGQTDQLKCLLDLIQSDAGEHGDERPRVVFLGDYVDRGPDSKGVLDLLSSGELEERFDPIYVLGNHDAAFMSIVRAAGNGELDRDAVHAWFTNGGIQAVESFGVATAGRGPRSFLWDLASLVPGSHMTFLAGLKACHREPGLFFSHAGVDPDRSLDDQTTRATLYGNSALFEFDDDWSGSVLRDRLGARIVHGHWQSEEVVVWPHRVGVDTGAGYSDGWLSAVAISGDEIRVIADEGGRQGDGLMTGLAATAAFGINDH